ncbi:MAG: hypothetical protein IVW52_10565 [Acidimicrobiales bacterium]|nr:hypothetical protein [Acidimicrobiales bacterium]
MWQRVAEPEVRHEATTGSHGTPTTASLSGYRSAVIAGLTVTVLYTALSLFCWQHLVATGVTTHMYRLNLGDVGQRVWFMAWLPFAIAHHTNPLVSTYMFAPHGINVLANASVLLEAFLLAPITELSSPITSLNIAGIAAPVVSALSLYYVLRRYEMRRSVAFVGGLIYGFSPALLQFNGLADFNLSWMFFPPLAVYLLDRIFFRQTGRPMRLGLLLGLLIVLQFFSGQEILLDFVVVAGPVLALAIVANPRQISSHARFAIKGTATAVATAGVLLIYPMVVYFNGPDHVATLGPKVMPGAALSSPVWPSTATGHGFLKPLPGTPWQHLFDNAFAGPLTIVLALAALFFARRHRVVLLLWAATLWCIALSWGSATRLTGSDPTFSWHAPAWYLSKAIPILKNVAWIRISILTDLLLALLVAITLDGVTSAIQANGGVWRRHLGDVTAAGAGVLVAIPLLVAGNVPYVGFESVAVPDVLRHVPTGNNGSPVTVLLYPPSSPFSGTPLAWQAVAGFPYRDFEGYAWHPQPGQRTANAGANPSPLGYIVGTAPGLSPSITLTHALCREFAASFVRNSVRVTVVIGGYPGSEPLTRVYDQIFGPGRRFGDGEIWNAANNRC